MPAKLFLIDAHALCYSSFYAIKGLSSSKGQATNAVYGFVNTLKKILRDHQPEYLAVCFDSAAKTHRQKKFAEYKIQRPIMPQDLISQIPIIHDVVKAYNLEIFEIDGYEADDIIATLAKKALKEGLEVVIVSEDKDMYQLADKNLKFFSTRKDEIFGMAEIKEKLGFDPYKITDFIALAGDSVDNIPGIDGIGEVTARNLINDFGSLESLLKNVEKVKSEKLRERIQTQKEIAILSRDLAILESNVPLTFDLNQLEVKAPGREKLFELFKELEFRKFAEEFTTRNSEEVEIVNLSSEDQIQDLIKHIKKTGQFCFLFDYEEKEDLVTCEGMHVVVNEGTQVFRLELSQMAFLKEVFENKKILKITHDAKESLKVLAQHDCLIEGSIFDVMLAGYLLSSSQASFAISDLSWAYLKTSLTGSHLNARKTLMVNRLYPLLVKELEEKALRPLFDNIEMPLTYVLSQMEHQGVNLDLDFLATLSKECEGKINHLTLQLHKLAGEEFNLNSPKQLSHILFDVLKLPVVKKTKTGFSTDEEVLSTLAKNHDFPSLILEYRQLAKLKSTYIDALPRLINPQTGRIHTQFIQTGAETGRLSSRNPNLQNIPIRTDLGKQVRRAFIPSQKKWSILSADYSQIELRILADLSKDENLAKAFNEEQDIHRYTASLVFDIKEEEVTAHMRDLAKRVNFGIIYGMSSFGLAKDLGISNPEAQDFIDRYFLRYPKVKEFMDQAIKYCEANGYVLTILNRRRYIPEIHSENLGMRQFAQRQAMNTPVQGSAADLIKLAMINIQNEIKKNKLESRMLITVHDELVFEVPLKEKDVMIDLVRQQMEHPIKLSVPIKTSIKLGPNWLNLKEIV